MTSRIKIRAKSESAIKCKVGYRSALKWKDESGSTLKWKDESGVALEKGQCHEIFDFWFFSWISFPQAPEYTIWAVSNFFENSRRYSQLKVCHRCRWHRWQMQNIFNHKSFNYLVCTPREVEETYRNIFAFKFTLRSQQPNIVPFICHRCRRHRWQVSLIPAAILPPVLLIPVANLPPVSLIPVVHLDLRISPRIFEKIRNGPNGILWGWGETDS